MPPNPRYMKNLNLSFLHDAPLHTWNLPKVVTLQDSLREHRDVFLRALYSATDADDVTAAAKEFEKKIYEWIIIFKTMPEIKFIAIFVWCVYF